MLHRRLYSVYSQTEIVVQRTHAGQELLVVVMAIVAQTAATVLVVEVMRCVALITAAGQARRAVKTVVATAVIIAVTMVTDVVQMGISAVLTIPAFRMIRDLVSDQGAKLVYYPVREVSD